MGKLRDALRRKYPNAKAAMRALGLDESLLDAERLAYDGKRRGDSGLPDEADVEAFHDSVRLVDDDDENEEAESEMDPAVAREFRRWQMKKLGDQLVRDKGWTHDQVREMFEHPDFPKTGIETGGAGGGALAEDIDHVMSELEGASNKPTSDRRKRMARDRALARDEVRKHFGTARLEPRANEMTNWGDQPTLAYDEREDDGSFDQFYPSAKHIGIAG